MIYDLKYYDELSIAAQLTARVNIIADLENHHRKRIAQTIASFKNDPHKVINDTKHIQRLINGAKALYSVRHYGDDYLIRFIRDNRLIFTPGGSYITYSNGFMMIIGGKEYTPTTSQQKALRELYIAINERGPSYHDWLYRIHHKIKNFMIPA